MAIDKDLLKSIKENSSYLEVINLSYLDSVSEQDMVELADALNRNTHVRHIYFDNIQDLNDEKIKPILPLLDEQYLTVSLKNTPQLSEGLKDQIEELRKRKKMQKFNEISSSTDYEFTSENVLISNNSDVRYPGFIAVFPNQEKIVSSSDWKFHLCVHPDDLSRAWNVLMRQPEFRNYHHKIILPLRAKQLEAFQLAGLHKDAKSLADKIIIILALHLQSTTGLTGNKDREVRDQAYSDIHEIHDLMQKIHKDSIDNKPLNEEYKRKANSFISKISATRESDEKLSVDDEISLTSYVNSLNKDVLEKQTKLLERLVNVPITVYFKAESINNFANEKELSNKINQWLSDAKIRPGTKPITDAKLNEYVSVRNDSVNDNRDKSFFVFTEVSTPNKNPFFDDILKSLYEEDQWLKNAVLKDDQTAKSDFSKKPLINKGMAFLHFLMNTQNSLSEKQESDFISLFRETFPIPENFSNIDQDSKGEFIYFLNILHRAVSNHGNKTSFLEKILEKNNQKFAKDFVLTIKKIEKQLNPILVILEDQNNIPKARFANEVQENLKVYKDDPTLQLQMLEHAFDYLMMNKDLQIFKVKPHAGFSFLPPRKDQFQIDKHLQDYLKIMKDTYYEIVKKNSSSASVRQMAKESRLVDFNRTRYQLFYKETTHTREQIKKLGI